MTKKQFCWVWRDSSKDSVLNQFYYEHEDLIKANKVIYKIENYIKENRLNNGNLDNFDVKVILHFIEEYQNE